MPIKIFNLITTFIFITSFTQCANQGAPGGGPVDKQPPVVIKTTPNTDSIRVPVNLRDIYIEFSERMEEGSVSKAVFISPPLNYEYKWSRSRKLKLVITDTLLEQQTYVVSIGTEASDEHSNKLESSYQFAFSTGEKIDKGSIAGKVYGIQKNETFNIFAFILSDSGKQDFIKRKPRYISQSGKDGQYSLNYLKADTYRLFAVQDLNNNLLIDADYEKIGIPLKDITINDKQLNFTGLNFRISKVDTVAPYFTGIRPVNNEYLQLRVSEPLILNDKTNLHIIDSLNSDTLKILGRSVNYESDNIIDIFTETMDTSARYQLFSNYIEDSSGNRNITRQKVNFISNLKTDTTGLKLIEFIPADSAKSVYPATPVYLEFSRPVNWQSVENNFNLMNGERDTLTGNWKILSVYDAEFYPGVPFETDSSYTAFLNFGKISDLWGKLFEDSLIHHYFSFISSRELGEVSGKVSADSLLPGPVYLTLKKLSKGQGKNYFRQKLDKPGVYRIEQVPEGQYGLSVYWDLDKNNQYSAGRLFPFSFAEPFSVLADTIKVRKRWETQGVNIKLPVPGGK